MNAQRPSSRRRRTAGQASWTLLSSLAAFVTLAAGCPPKKGDGDDPSSRAPATKAATTPIATPTAAPTTTGEVPSPPPAGQQPSEPEYRAGAHILIGFQGAMRATATRTKEEALALASKLAVAARKAPDKFAELARKHSEGPTGPTGGDLGSWEKGKMVKSFDEAIDKLKVGEVSAAVESPFGYHVIIRREPPPAVELSAQQFVIAYKGAMRAAPKVARDKAAAQRLATQLQRKASQEPGGFAALVKRHSDGPDAEAGGQMGPWHSLHSRMPPVFTQAVIGLKVGQVSRVVETPFGFHVFKRVDPPPLLAGSHILVAYKGASRAAPTITRTKEEAKKRIEELARELNKSAGKLVELAAKNSDCPSASSGGSLGTWRKGKMTPVFDAAVVKLKVGEISDPVESPFGYHLIRRDEPEQGSGGGMRGMRPGRPSMPSSGGVPPRPRP